MKRPIQKFVSGLLSVFLLLGISTTALALDPPTAAPAKTPLTVTAELNKLALMKGVTPADFDLGRAPTKVEAAVMLIRLLGQDPFQLPGCGTICYGYQDVPEWAELFVERFYQLGLMKEVSPTEFGSNKAVSANEYLTALLLLLGYQEGTDFTAADPQTMAKEIGLLTSNVQTAPFLRGDMALLSWNALTVKFKNSSETVGQRLVAQGILTQAQYDSLPTAFSHEVSLYFPNGVNRFPVGTKSVNLVLYNDMGKEITTGQPFTVQYLGADGQWTEVPLALFFTMELLMIAPGESKTFVCPLDDGDYQYQPGQYRITKTAFQDDMGLILTAEFTLE